MEFKPGSYGYIALRDLDVARDMAQIHPSASLFHSQQAVEKMLKQYVLERFDDRHMPLLRTHNLRRLAKGAQVPGVEGYMHTLYELTDAYFNSRYPGEDYYEATDAEAQTLYDAAKAVCDVILRELQ